MMQRRSVFAGLGALLAAPAIIRTPGLLMAVKAAPLRDTGVWVSGGMLLPRAAIGPTIFVSNSGTIAIAISVEAGAINLAPGETRAFIQEGTTWYAEGY